MRWLLYARVYLPPTTLSNFFLLLSYVFFQYLISWTSGWHYRSNRPKRDVNLWCGPVTNRSIRGNRIGSLVIKIRSEIRLFVLVKAVGGSTNGLGLNTHLSASRGVRMRGFVYQRKPRFKMWLKIIKYHVNKRCRKMCIFNRATMSIFYGRNQN